MKTLAIITGLLLSLSVQARIFAMKDAKFAGYLNLSYGSSEIKDSFFENESTATAFSKGFKVNSGGEFGFVYYSDFVAWIFGFEMIKPQKISSGTATTGATQNYKYSSEVSAFVPKIGAEISLYQDQTFRLFINGTVGTASLTTKTDYSSVTIAPNANFTVEGKGSANLASGGMGAEFHWTDNTTFMMEMGYRDLTFRKVKYVQNVTDFQGAHTAGATILKTDGTKLKIDMTGMYYIVGLRFWLF